MTHTNTGISHWKPYETSGAATQRIVLANPAATLGKKKLLSQDRPQSDVTPALPPGLGLSQNDVKDYLRSLENLPPLFRENEKIRDPFHCSLCENAGYHSWIFDLAWIKQCPVHQTLGNKAAFQPIITEDSLNRTPQCSTSNADKQAVYRRWKHAQLDPRLYLQTLKPIAEFCATDNHLTPVNLYSPYQLATNMPGHSCLYPTDEVFPDVMITLFPNTRNMIQHAHVKSQKIVRHTIPRYPHPCLSDSYSSYLNIQCISLKQKAVRRVKQFLKYTFPDIQCECAIGNSFSQPLCIPAIAFQIWRSILSSGLTFYPWAGIVGSHLFRYFSPYLGSSVIPQPMQRFWTGRYTPHPREIDYTTDDATLPTPLTLLVYEIDLWNMFRALLVFLLRIYIDINSTWKYSSTLVEIIESIPAWAIPGNHFSDDINIYLINDQFLLTFPFSYIDPYCQDLNPLFESYSAIGS